MKFVFRLFLISILMMPIVSIAQTNRQAEKQQKKLEKLKEQRKKEEERNYKKAVKEHFKMQSPETKKMMKKTFRESLRQSKNRDRFFLKRWYDNIFHKRQMKENKQNQGKNPMQKA